MLPWLQIYVFEFRNGGKTPYNRIKDVPCPYIVRIKTVSLSVFEHSSRKILGLLKYKGFAEARKITLFHISVNLS